MNVMLDTTSTYLVRQTGVLGYASWGSNAQNWSAVTDQAKQYNSYTAGAIGETYVSTSGRSFSTGLTYGQSAVADMIAEGITGVKGYVYEPYASSMTDVNTLFPMYTEGYTLAESFYSASPYMSWMDVVVGDPKCRIVNSVHNSQPLPVELVSFTLASSNNSIILNWKTATETNNYGFDIERKQGDAGTFVKIGFVAGNGTSSVAHTYTFTDPVSGIYTYRLKQIDRDGQFIYSAEITNSVTGVENAALAPKKFDLGQNFPNPFNPSTKISYSIATPELVHLTVYDVTGRVVATLVNGHQEAGSYSVQWNASAVPSGVYFYRIDAGSFSSVKKLLLQK
ncbi:MAG TPA: T9SS type A sorting domain-containing protein, partial [Bacteroidota bacterium]|nr:T9SS type A sorting domain-containing protein [Bacteroidota bacterium]